MNKLAPDAILTIEFFVEPLAFLSLILLGQVYLGHQLIITMSKSTLKIGD
jgi:hypothetical protein